ncbi:cysteine-rich receptor-like protein kinase 8 [Tanacetum coccineum]
MSLSTINKCKYFLTIVDDFSRATWTYPLPSKDHATSQIKTFHSYVSNHFHKTIQTIRSDNGSEFLNSSLSTFFDHLGITHQTSCPYTPQQNARVERKHKQLLEVARALRFQANFSIHFWGHCILTSTYLINRLPSKPIHNKTPFECLHGTPPPLDHLRVIGCQIFAHQHLNDKFAARAIPSIFIGYPSSQKGYILYDLLTHKLFTSRHVTFHENIFPFHISPHETSPTKHSCKPNSAASPPPDTLNNPPQFNLSPPATSPTPSTFPTSSTTPKTSITDQSTDSTSTIVLPNTTSQVPLIEKQPTP